MNDRQVARMLGPIRSTEHRDGLTRPQAERELRQRMQEVKPAPVGARLTVADAGERLLRHLDGIGRKPSTMATYRSLLDTHLIPAIGSVELIVVTPEQSSR